MTSSSSENSLLILASFQLSHKRYFFLFVPLAHSHVFINQYLCICPADSSCHQLHRGQERYVPTSLLKPAPTDQEIFVASMFKISLCTLKSVISSSGFWPWGRLFKISNYFTSKFPQVRPQPRCTGTLSIRPSCWRRGCWNKRGMHTAISTIPCPAQVGASWRSVPAMERLPKQMRSFSSWLDTWKASWPPSMWNPSYYWWVWWSVRSLTGPSFPKQDRKREWGVTQTHF